MSFTFPYTFFFLLAVPVYMIWGVLKYRAHRSLYEQLQVKRKQKRKMWVDGIGRHAFHSLIYTLFVIIISEPRIEQIEPEKNNSTIHATLLLDISLSMYVGSPNERRIDEAIDFLTTYVKQPTERSYSLIVFADLPSLIVPKTDDKEYLLESFLQLKVRPPVIATTNITKVITKIENDKSYYLHGTNNSQTAHEIVFVSDGEFHDFPATSILKPFKGASSYAFVPTKYPKGQSAYFRTNEGGSKVEQLPEFSITDRTTMRKLIEYIDGQIVEEPEFIEQNQIKKVVDYFSLNSSLSLLLLLYLFAYPFLHKL